LIPAAAVIRATSAAKRSAPKRQSKPMTTLGSGWRRIQGSAPPLDEDLGSGHGLGVELGPERAAHGADVNAFRQPFVADHRFARVGATGDDVSATHGVLERRRDPRSRMSSRQ